MAKQKPKSSLAFRLAAGEKEAVETVRSKPKPKPKPRPQAKPVSFSSNLVFDPTGQFSDILSDEQKARRDLYLERTGRELADEADERVALESVGLLKPGIGSAERKKLAKGGSDEFASALDAYDAIDRSGDFVGGQINKQLGRALPTLTLGGAIATKNLIEAVENVPLPGETVFGEKDKPRTVGQEIGGIARGVVGTVGDVGRFVIQDAQPAPTTREAPKRPSGGRPTFGTGGLKQTRPAQDIVGEALGRIPVPTVRPPVIRSSSSGQLGAADFEQVRLGDVQDAAQTAVNKPNELVDASAADKTIIPNASEPVAGGVLLANDGVGPAEVQSYLDQQAAFDGISPNEDAALKARAQKEGHDVGQWDSLLAGEKIVMAYSSSNYWLVTFRNAVRAVAALGATPAGVKAIGDAAFALFRGDTEEGRKLIRGLLEPYAYAKEVAARDGLAAGLEVAFRDNPFDVAIAANATIRGAGRVGGVAARSGVFGEKAAATAEVGRRIVVPRGKVTEVREVPLTPGPFRYDPNAGPIIQQYSDWAQRSRAAQVENADEIAASVEAGRVTDAGVPYRIERAPGPDEVVIGYTTPNLTSVVSLKFKGALAKNFPKYADFLLDSQGRRYTRTLANIADGKAVEIERLITEAIGSRPTAEQLDRIAWDLSRDRELFGGEEYTPRVEADYYRSRIEREKATGKYRKDPENADSKARILRWEAAANRLDEIDKVVIKPEVTARVRAAAKQIGDENLKIIAAALGQTITVAKRKDRIRLLLVDPRFEAAARELKAEKNLGKQSPKALIKSQRRIAVLAAKISKSVSERGVGKKSRPKSRVAFAALRSDLVDELRRAERAALALGDEALANEYRAARQELTLSRVGSSERSAEVAARAARVGRLEADVADLPVAARGAYGAALEARRLEDEAEVASVAATTAAREAAARAGVSVVNKTAIDAARAQLVQARKNYEVDKDSTSLTPEQIEQSRLAVVRAEERLVALREAEAAQLAGVEARGALRTAISKRESAARQAQQIIEKNAPVLDTNQVRAALDASGNLASVRIRRKKDYGYYTLERARGEVLDDFIARVDAADKGALLHLVQRSSFERIGEPVVLRAARAIETGPQGRIRKGRLKPSKGSLFAMGGEDFGEMWRNLMFDTSELQSAVGWRKRMQQLIEMTSVKVSVSQQILSAAERAVQKQIDADASLALRRDELLRIAVKEELGRDSFEFNAGDFELLNPIAPKSRKPKQSEPRGAVEDKDDVRALLTRMIDDRAIDPNAPGDYYLMPRALYNGIQKSLNDEAFSFRPGTIGFKLDRVMRAWRSLTLNVLPRTAFANFAGSAVLSLQGGAGPRSWMYAWRALTGRVDPKTGRAYPVPQELLQRYYDQFTPEIGRSGRLSEQPTPVQVGASWVAWWMNSMRRLNGMSEDFGRLAVWYSKALPEALRVEARGVDSFLSRAKRMNDSAMDVLDAMASNDPAWVAKNDAWLRQSYDFLGYLHRGGPTASWVRIAIPFWQWYLHMLKLTFVTMPLKYPGRALMLQQLGNIGDEYQRAHGVIAPGSASLIPLWTFEVPLEGQPQFVIKTTDSSPWYPQATASSLGSKDGDLGLSRYVRGGVNPQFSNLFLLVQSAMLGNPQEYSDYDGLTAAKDEYGNELKGFNWRYVVNKLGQMMPLAPTVMSMAGRSSDSLLWDLKEKPEDGARLPVERTDLLSVFDDPWGPDVLKFFGRILSGMQLKNTPGIGPIQREILRRQFEYEAREARREERNIAEKIAQNAQ